MKNEAMNFLNEETYCIISTTDTNGKPESAFVAFSENEKLEIMIGTSKGSRKYKNIVRNPHVALVFGFDGKQTLQYEGKARVLSDEERKQRLEKHFEKQPSAAKYEADPKQVYLIIEPTWLRISTSGPVVLGEMRFE